MKKNRVSPVKMLLLFAVILCLGFSGVQTTRAALSVQSNYYRAQANMQDTGIAIMENGVQITDRFNEPEYRGRLLGGDLMLMNGETVADFNYGVRYRENLAVKNTGTIDQFVRVFVTRYWAELDENGNVIRKLPELNPELIEVRFVDGNWTNPVLTPSGERYTLYYTGNGGILAPDEVSPIFADSIRVNGDLELIVSTVTTDVVDGKKVTVYTYIYDGKAFILEVEAQGVQTHNAKDAVISAWGKEASEILTNAGVLK